MQQVRQFCQETSITGIRETAESRGIAFFIWLTLVCISIYLSLYSVYESFAYYFTHAKVTEMQTVTMDKMPEVVICIDDWIDPVKLRKHGLNQSDAKALASLAKLHMYLHVRNYWAEFLRKTASLNVMGLLENVSYDPEQLIAVNLKGNPLQITVRRQYVISQGMCYKIICSKVFDQFLIGEAKLIILVDNTNANGTTGFIEQLKWISRLLIRRKTDKGRKRRSAEDIQQPPTERKWKEKIKGGLERKEKVGGVEFLNYGKDQLPGVDTPRAEGSIKEAEPFSGKRSLFGKGLFGKRGFSGKESLGRKDSFGEVLFGEKGLFGKRLLGKKGMFGKGVSGKNGIFLKKLKRKLKWPNLKRIGVFVGVDSLGVFPGRPSPLTRGRSHQIYVQPTRITRKPSNTEPCSQITAEQYQSCVQKTINAGCRREGRKEFVDPRLNQTVRQVGEFFDPLVGCLADLNNFIHRLAARIEETCILPCETYLFTTDAYQGGEMPGFTRLIISYVSPTRVWAVQEEFGYSINALLEDTGGQISLYTGASLISLVHLVYYWINAMCICCTRVRSGEIPAGVRIT